MGLDFQCGAEGREIGIRWEWSSKPPEEGPRDQSGLIRPGNTARWIPGCRYHSGTSRAGFAASRSDVRCQIGGLESALVLSQGASLADTVGSDCNHSFSPEIAPLAFLPCCFLLRMLTGINSSHLALSGTSR